MHVELIPLGTNGYYPSHGRQTMSFLLLCEEHALLLDAGTGVSRMQEPAIAEKLARYDRLDVVLSHYHLDHVVGLFYLLGVWVDREVRIHAPGRPFVDADPESALRSFFRPPLISIPFDALPMPTTIIPLDTDHVEIGPYALRLWRQDHPGGSMGVRFGDTLAYTTDKCMKAGDVEHLTGVRNLLHEVWLTEDETVSHANDLAVHSCADAVARLACDAGVQHIFPVHHHPKRSDGEIQAIAQDLETRSGIASRVLLEGASYHVS